MYLEQKIKGILDALLPTFNTEDISFDLVKVEDGVAEVNLLIGPKACMECIVPEEILQTILLKEIRKDLPVIRELKVHKTKEGGNG